MTTELHPGGPPQDPRPTGNQPLPRQERVGHAALPSDNRTRSSVITARAAASFDPVGRSVATARSFVRDTLQGWGFADIVDDAVVLTSELVTNAVVHAGTSADVLCLRSDEGVRIEVGDRYPEREIPLQATAINMGSPDREEAAASSSAPPWPAAGASSTRPRTSRSGSSWNCRNARWAPARPAPPSRPTSSRSPTAAYAWRSSRSTAPAPSTPGTRTRRNCSGTPPSRSSASPSPTSRPGRTRPAPAPASSRRSNSPAGRAATACAPPTAV